MEIRPIKYFCSDLDNTLIYSYKHDIGNRKDLVETMNGKELSYMSADTHVLLQKIAEKLCFVPVTTRSLAQYKRINFGNKVSIPFALVANGGILLEGGVASKTWFEQTRQMVAAVDDELELAISFLKKDDCVNFEIRKVDGLFIFTKSSNSSKTVENLKKVLDEKKVYIDSNGCKVYVFPKVLNKGESLKRFRNYVSKDGFFIAAGDSQFDIPMLVAADMGLCPEGLILEKENHIRTYDKKYFTKLMLEDVLEFSS